MAQEIIFSEDVKQELNFTLDNGELIKLKIFYIAILQGFYLISYTYKNVEKNVNLRICINPFGILSQFDNVLPFDLICISEDNVEPVYLNDFATGRCKLFIFSQEEKKELLS